MKKLSMVLVVLLVLSFFAGCTSEEPAAPAVDGETPVAAAEPVEIALWEQMDPVAQDVFDAVAADFMAAHPEITIVRTHYETEDKDRIWFMDRQIT